MINYERWYKQIENLLGKSLEEFLNGDEDAIKMQSTGFMDLNIDRLHTNRIALSHYYQHPSGDMIANPDMEVYIDTKQKIAMPCTFQDTYGYSDAYEYDGNMKITGVYPKVRAKLNSFFGFWLKNLIAQGFAR